MADESTIQRQLRPEFGPGSNLPTPMGTPSDTAPDIPINPNTPEGVTMLDEGWYVIAWGDIDKVPGLKDALAQGRGFGMSQNPSGVNCEFDILCNDGTFTGSPATYAIDGQYFGNVGSNPPTHARWQINESTNIPQNIDNFLMPAYYDIPGNSQGEQTSIPIENYQSGVPQYSFAQPWFDFAGNLLPEVNSDLEPYVFDFYNHYGPWQDNMDTGPHAPIYMRQSMQHFYWPGDTLENWSIAVQNNYGVGMVMRGMPVVSDENNNYPAPSGEFISGTPVFLKIVMICILYYLVMVIFL